MEHTGPWPDGTPCWVDLTVSDLARSQAFYRAVLGWDYTPSSEAYGGYCNALVGGSPVAGLSPAAPGWTPGPWTVYLASDDIIGADTRAVDAGAGRVLEPMEVDPFGWMGLWSDPAGALFGVWQSGEHTGFRRTEEPGCVAWIDLLSRDPEAARAFYAEVFDFTYADLPPDPEGGARYAMFSVPGGGRPAGGIGEHDPEASYPDGWSVNFQVPDVDALLRVIVSSGGAVLGEPFDFEFGRSVMAQGPDKEVFGLFTPAPGGMGE